MRKKENTHKWITEASALHKTYHQFEKWMVKSFGTDLYDKEESVIEVGNKKFKFRHFNELEFSRRIVGYDVQIKIERYVARYLPEIKVIKCDDSVFASSILLLIPHPEMGISVMFIPQCTTIQNNFFLYENHYKQLMKELTKMKSVYAKPI